MALNGDHMDVKKLPVTHADVGDYLKVIGKELKPVLGAMNARIEELERQLAATREDFLESRKLDLADAHRGTWKAETVYSRGDLIAHQGSMWLALKQSAERPPSGSWRLIVKCGRNGKTE